MAELEPSGTPKPITTGELTLSKINEKLDGVLWHLEQEKKNPAHHPRGSIIQFVSGLLALVAFFLGILNVNQLQDELSGYGAAKNDFASEANSKCQSLTKNIKFAENGQLPAARDWTVTAQNDLWSMGKTEQTSSALRSIPADKLSSSDWSALMKIEAEYSAASLELWLASNAALSKDRQAYGEHEARYLEIASSYIGDVKEFGLDDCAVLWSVDDQPSQ